MLLLRKFFRLFVSDVEKRVGRVEDRILAHLKSLKLSRHGVWHFGATDIDPKHLMVLVKVGTDEERDRIRAEGAIDPMCREWFHAEGYPEKAIEHIHIDIESFETVERESNGSWFWHYK